MWVSGLTALLSHWRRHPLQLLTLVAGLAAATALWTGVQAINAEARASYDEAATALGQGTETRLTRRDGEAMPPETFAELRGMGWLVSPVVEGRLGRVTLVGIDPFTLPPSPTRPALTDGESLGRFVSEGIVQAHPETPEVPGITYEIAANLPVGEAVTDITTAWELLDRREISYFVLLPNQPRGLPPLPDTLVRSEQDTGAEIARLTRSFHLNLTAFGFLSFAVGLFIVHAAMGLAFEQRRAMFRTLRALGLPTRTVTTLIAAEALALATVAGALGIGLGYLIATALLPGVAATLGGLYGASVPGSLTLDWRWMVSGAALAFVGAMAATATNIWRAARMPILAPARPRAWAMANARALRWQAVAGLVFLAIAGIIAATGHRWEAGLLAGFTMMGGLLFGAALILPLALDTALCLLQPLAKGPLAAWTIADTRQQVPGLSLALMALLLALAVNIGVGTMVSSFRATFTGWIEQRLASELYVTASTADQARELEAFLEANTDKAIPLRTTETRLRGAPGDILGVIDHVTYRDGWPLVVSEADAWARVAAGTGALVNEQLWRREGLSLGDPLRLLPDWELPVVGYYTDYGNPRGQAMVGQAELLARVPDISPLRYAARLDPARIPELREDLEALGIQPGAILDQATVKRFSLDVFERTFLVTGALNVLTLGVAAFAILASLTTLGTMRLPQVAPVWAMGITRSRLAWLELARAALAGALTFILALPLGLAVAWALLAVVNVQAFGWRLPLLPFPLDWARLGVLALLAAVAAALIPALRLARTDPSRLLKVFADER
ncbi:MAG: ABC transporter permease [Pseudomonadota bacterium]